MMRLNRLKKELETMNKSPPPGITWWPKDEDKIDQFEAKIIGADETPYAKGAFLLEITISERYPIDPPSVKFKTPIYHPNIDSGGRICLDVLNLPPKGSWKPSWNISSVLSSIQLLMSHPNPEDGLMAEITQQYKENHKEYFKTAMAWTEKHAKEHKL